MTRLKIPSANIMTVRKEAVQCQDERSLGIRMSRQHCVSDKKVSTHCILLKHDLTIQEDVSVICLCTIDVVVEDQDFAGTQNLSMVGQKCEMSINGLIDVTHHIDSTRSRLIPEQSSYAIWLERYHIAEKENEQGIHFRDQ
jgi:hypothetical protein